MGIAPTKIRATITGPGFSVATPDILSFYVRKARGQLDSFSFSIKVDSQQSTTTGLVNINDVFSGVMTSVKIRPCFEDPSKVIMDGSGTDVRKYLEGKQFTRRQTSSETCWVEITGLTSPGLRSSKLKYTSTGDLASMGGFLYAVDSIDKSEAGKSNSKEQHVNNANKVSATGNSKTNTMLRAEYVAPESE